LVGLAVAEHGEDDVAASPGEADQGGVVFLAFGAFAVVGAGSRVFERGERGKEERSFELLVTAAGRMLSADRAA
jgi:hypothetical protein